ncbi:MAG: hypothetical protein BWK78_03605 [Thiotrichaceae bacterium IS1]|nr:MAG: hypothetical protein BWK78_03605 [Thiotrichaceae bacterium IS1]
MQQIHDELLRLQEQLTLLDRAVKQIAKAEAIATAVVQATATIQQEYVLQLHKIAEFYQTHLEQITASHQSQVDKFQMTSEQTLATYTTAIQEMSTLVNQAQNVSVKIQQWVEFIDKINLPLRLDKLDLTVSGINQGVQNTLMRVETSERNLREEIKLEVGKQSQELKMLKGLLWLVTVLSSGIIMMLFLWLSK